MLTKVLDGKLLAETIQAEILEEVVCLEKERGRKPCLAVVIVGDDPASQVYVKNKHKACLAVGINSMVIKLEENIKEENLIEQIEKLNNDLNVDGILVQLPLPKNINTEKILSKINHLKDVDGFHPLNAGNLFLGTPKLIPCTPAGILELLKRNGIEIKGKHAVVIGRSNIVGRPMSMLLLKENATVTLCHSQTKNIAKITKEADLLFAAVGIPKFVKQEMVKEGAVVIDVGINRLEGKLVGDVDFEEVVTKAGYITKVPGGVGPLTIAMLLKNTLKAFLGKV